MKFFRSYIKMFLNLVFVVILFINFNSLRTRVGTGKYNRVEFTLGLRTVYSKEKKLTLSHFPLQILYSFNIRRKL